MKKNEIKRKTKKLKEMEQKKYIHLSFKSVKMGREGGREGGKGGRREGEKK